MIAVFREVPRVDENYCWNKLINKNIVAMNAILTQSIVQKLTASAKLKPWLNPLW